MGVARDEARNDSFAGIVDDLRTIGDGGCGGRTDGDDAPAADDDCRVINRSTASSIDHAGAAKGSGLGIHSGGCPYDER